MDLYPQQQINDNRLKNDLKFIRQGQGQGLPLPESVSAPGGGERHYD